ncbi:cell division protein FtsW [Bacteroides luti]|jgi:cell division protein FtsW|uniref:Probable peptidoglycan glycosyltransferase FtsW n=1 Tax=Bacteroides luti TaxID=1297750 RepID=A0A1M5A2P9_9BACE|nr:FtsW/RodA/SpoVE family cell cycle protein [Bacteroides luti]SHF24563.1 cell division protein FtsW [Bacteroides luti]
MDLLKNLFKGDKVIWIIFLFLCVISVVEVFSAASTLTYKTGDHWAPITQHTVILLVGVLVVWITHKVNYRYFQAIPVFLVPISVILLVLVVATGAMTNGAARWMNIFGLQFQPSELAKMAVIIAVSYILAKNQEEDEANPRAFKYIMWITGLICALIAPENLSTAALLFGVVFLMMIIGRIPFRKLAILVGSIAAIGIFTIGVTMLVPDNTNIKFLHRMTTWKNRVFEFASPKKDIPAAKFDIDGDAQVAHANIAIATSNIIGKMPGNSVERDFLSQAFSDFIFAIIIEELGLIGGGFVVILYIWLLIRAGRIAQKAKGNFATFLVMGISLLLVSQAIMNMCVAVGLIPVTGQPLPLISKGGTSTLINCVYVGMILSVSRYTAKLEENSSSIDTKVEDTTINKEEIIAEESLA